MRIADGQIKDIGLRDQRDPGHTDFQPDSVRFEIIHHTRRRTQTECTAAAEGDGMNDLGGHERIEQLRFPRRRSAPAHIHPGAHAFRTHKHGAASPCLRILHLPDPNLFNLRHRNLCICVHSSVSFRLRSSFFVVCLIVPYFPRLQ